MQLPRSYCFPDTNKVAADGKKHFQRLVKDFRGRRLDRLGINVAIGNGAKHFASRKEVKFEYKGGFKILSRRCVQMKKM